MSLILVTGGARSGKSAWAERQASELAQINEANVIYIATAEVKDLEMRLRVAQHRKSRPKGWKTIEAPRGVAAEILRKGKIESSSILLFDCVTMLASNIMTNEKSPITEPEKAEQALKAELRAVLRIVKERQAIMIMVTNELNAGIVPENELARTYRDVVGRVNQWLAQQADTVWYTVSGMALPLHKLGTPVFKE